MLKRTELFYNYRLNWLFSRDLFSRDLIVFDCFWFCVWWFQITTFLGQTQAKRSKINKWRSPAICVALSLSLGRSIPGSPVFLFLLPLLSVVAIRPPRLVRSRPIHWQYSCSLYYLITLHLCRLGHCVRAVFHALLALSHTSKFTGAFD